MINLITGVPGAGKTYLAVKFIYDEITSKDPRYKFVYTNINLNFDKFNEIKDSFVKPLNLDDLMDRIQSDYEMSELFKRNQLFDDETGELITDYDSYVRSKLKLFEPYEHSLIVLDECHLYFTSSTDDKLLRFLSYHRHFDIDMILITQNKSLINRKYLAFVENMYIGENPSKRFFSKIFVYKLYASWKEYKSNLVGKEKYKFDSKIASLYNSGSTKINKSFTSRLLIPFILLSILAFLMFLGFKNYITCGSVFGCSHKSNNNVKHYNSSSHIVNNDYVNSPRRFVPFNDDSFSDYSYFYKIDCFKLKCIANTRYIFSIYLLPYLKKHSLVMLDEISYKYRIIYLATNIDLSKFQGAKNEETNNSTSFFK